MLNILIVLALAVALSPVPAALSGCAMITAFAAILFPTGKSPAAGGAKLLGRRRPAAHSRPRTSMPSCAETPCCRTRQDRQLRGLQRSCPGEPACRIAMAVAAIGVAANVPRLPAARPGPAQLTVKQSRLGLTVGEIWLLRHYGAPPPAHRTTVRPLGPASMMKPATRKMRAASSTVPL